MLFISSVTYILLQWWVLILNTDKFSNNYLAYVQNPFPHQSCPSYLHILLPKSQTFLYFSKALWKILFLNLWRAFKVFLWTLGSPVIMLDLIILEISEEGFVCLFVCLNHLTLIYDSFKHKRTPWRFPCMSGQVLHISNGTTELGWEPTCDVTCLDLDNVGSDLHHHLLVHQSCHLTDQCPLGSMCPGQPPFIGKHRHLLRGQVTHDHLNAQN